MDVRARTLALVFHFHRSCVRPRRAELRTDTAEPTAKRYDDNIEKEFISIITIFYFCVRRQRRGDRDEEITPKQANAPGRTG